jgi:hypothetical protein
MNVTMSINDTYIDHINDQCPRFNISVSELFISNGDTFQLGDYESVLISTMGIKMNSQKYFRCVLNRVNGSHIVSVGKINNETLVCDPMQVGNIH